MKTNERHLSELDIKYISSSLGRIPTDIEISFIESILMKELEDREYLQILKRLDDGAKRVVNHKIKLDDNFNLIVNNGIKIINQDGSSIMNKDETKYINKINNLGTILDDIVINSSNNQNVENIFKKEVNNRKNTTVIGGRFISTTKDEITFSTSIGLDQKKKTNEKIKLIGYSVCRINFGKRYFQKNINLLKKSSDEINNDDCTLFAKSINWNGLGAALVDLIKECNYGISIEREITSDTIDSHFSDDNTLSILTVVQIDNLSQLKALCKKYDLRLEEIGTLTDDQIIRINYKSDTLINLPVSVFDLQYNVNTKHFIQSEIDIKPSKNISKNIIKTSYTNQLLRILTSITENDVLWENINQKNKLTTNHSNYGLYSNNDSIDDQIVLTQADKNHMIDISPRLSGRVAVASAVRRLSCTGAKPKAIVIQNIFPKVNPDLLWKASELMQGQEEAIRELEVEIGSRSLETIKDYWHQNISAIGIHELKNTKMDISFKNDGDFISLLGSHRGELTGSAYEQYITNEKSDVLPTVDLRMEKRLQDVVRQGINTNLIKTATNIGMGGISIAVAKSLVASDVGIGARIHLSRKLTDEELLFGETQGLVIVSLAEEDIMEFERICMTVGVPSTTIGRVTDNDLYTYNEAIKIKVDKLRTAL